MRQRLPRFLYGFLSASAAPVNMKMPWQPSDRDGLFKMNYSAASAERDNLLSWAYTNKGERVMDFEFGLDARRYLFDPTVVIKDRLINNAREQLKTYFSHLLIKELAVLTWEEDTSLGANSIRFILKASPRNDEDSVIELNEVVK